MAKPFCAVALVTPPPWLPRKRLLVASAMLSAFSTSASVDEIRSMAANEDAKLLSDSWVLSALTAASPSATSDTVPGEEAAELRAVDATESSVPASKSRVAA